MLMTVSGRLNVVGVRHEIVSATLDGRFGSLAVPQDVITRMAAIERIPAVR